MVAAMWASIAIPIGVMFLENRAWRRAGKADSDGARVRLVASARRLQAVRYISLAVFIAIVGVGIGAPASYALGGVGCLYCTLFAWHCLRLARRYRVLPNAAGATQANAGT
jgi:hypothetical protein